jgi:hypothetical protein
MPYIKQEDRSKFIDQASNIGETASCAGDLNYAISVIVHTYLKKKGLNYANVNEAMGALECCKLELYRAVAAPYETDKVNQNGPVGIIKEFGCEPVHEHPGQQKIF